MDMSTLRYQWNPDHTACCALTARGEILAVVEVDAGPVNERELAFRLLDRALEVGQVLRAHPDDPAKRVVYKVALYNPFSAEVSVGEVPKNVTFRDEAPLALPADGLPAEAVTAGRSRRLTFPDGRTLEPRELTFLGLTRVQASHQAA